MISCYECEYPLLVEDWERLKQFPEGTLFLDKHGLAYLLGDENGDGTKFAHVPGDEMSGYAEHVDYPVYVVYTPEDTGF